MLQKSKGPNYLSRYRKMNASTREQSTQTRKTDHILDSFLKLSLNDLRNITFRIYKLIQAASKTTEHHMAVDYSNDIFDHKEQPNL